MVALNGILNFTFFSENCIGGGEGGFNLGPVNLPRRHLLASELCLLRLPLKQAGLGHQLIVHQLRLLQLLLCLLDFCLKRFYTQSHHG